LGNYLEQHEPLYEGVNWQQESNEHKLRDNNENVDQNQEEEEEEDEIEQKS
jgi:hypothetical protein